MVYSLSSISAKVRCSQRKAELLDDGEAELLGDALEEELVVFLVGFFLLVVCFLGFWVEVVVCATFCWFITCLAWTVGANVATGALTTRANNKALVNLFTVNSSSKNWLLNYARSAWRFYVSFMEFLCQFGNQAFSQMLINYFLSHSQFHQLICHFKVSSDVLHIIQRF